MAGQLWAPTLVRAASFYAPFSAGSGDVRFHTPLGVASPARPVATQHLVFWRFGGIAPGHFLYPPLTATRPAAYNAYREAHLPAYKMDVDDYFGSQKTLIFSGRTGSQGQ